MSMSRVPLAAKAGAQPSRSDGPEVRVVQSMADAAREAQVKPSQSRPGQTPATPAAPAAAANPTLTLSNDSYSDSGIVSHKKIKFNVAVPSGATAADFCLVNKLQGTFKKPDGGFYKVSMYGKEVDFNFPTEQVDSIDEDPVYWSEGGTRWRYTTETGGFSATDDPGPVDTKGEVAAIKFHIGLYKLADVQKTTSGTIAATAIQELPWQYSVVSDAAGKLSHPTL